MKEQGEPLKPSWVDLKLLEVLDDQLNEFVQGYSFAEESSFLSKDGTKEV